MLEETALLREREKSMQSCKWEKNKRVWVVLGCFVGSQDNTEYDRFIWCENIHLMSYNRATIW